MHWRAVLVLAFGFLAGCSKPTPGGYQGYLEGDFIYVAPSLPGRLETLFVKKGARVESGTPLFALERASELAAQRQSAAELRSAQSRLDDIRKGARPTELSALEARLAQARAAAELSEREFVRVDDLLKKAVVAASDHDQARLARERDAAVVNELTAQLATARLGGRADAVTAAEAAVEAAAAARDRADWNVAHKAESSPRAALVYDTLYREGEFVPAGNPVLSLLPPENIKVRFFVPEGDFATFKAGDAVKVAITGLPAPLNAHVTYLSPKPEFTPPVLYNRENRSKLVFMVEATFDTVEGRDLHPGQPADVTR